MRTKLHLGNVLDLSLPSAELEDVQEDSELPVQEDSRDKVEEDSRKLKGKDLFEVENSLLLHLLPIVDSEEDSTVEIEELDRGKIEDLDSVDSREPLLSKSKGRVLSEVESSPLRLLKLLGGLSQVLEVTLRGQMEMLHGREVEVYPLLLLEVRGDLSELDSADVADLELSVRTLSLSLPLERFDN